MTSRRLAAAALATALLCSGQCRAQGAPPPDTINPWAQGEKRRRDEDRALDEAHRAYLERHHLTAVKVLDLQANGANMVGGYVAVSGFIKVFSENDVTIYSTPDDLNGVPLNIAHASPSTRRFIFAHCSSLSTDCKLEVDGTVAFDGRVSVDVE